MKLQDCYKNVVVSLTDWSQWTDGFVLFDDCDPSNDEEIPAYSYNPIITDYEFAFNGPEEAIETSVWCLNGFDLIPVLSGFQPMY